MAAKPAISGMFDLTDWDQTEEALLLVSLQLLAQNSGTPERIEGKGGSVLQRGQFAYYCHHHQQTYYPNHHNNHYSNYTRKNN